MGATRRPSCGENISDVAFIEEKHPGDLTKFSTEIRLFLELAIPTCLLGFGFTISPLLTASYVGLRFGPMFLSAFTLGNLTGNLSTFSLLAGLFSAADTLGPQAFGAGNYREVGLIALRGTVAGLAVVVPVNIVLFFYLDNFLVAMGQDPVASFHATEWYRVFVWSLPFFVIYDAVWKFLSAQHVMKPLICVSLFSCAVTLPIALEFFTEKYGFRGSAMAYVFFQASQCVLLIAYLAILQPHHEGTWVGLNCWGDVMKRRPFLEYVGLGFGGMVSQSEWIYWEALGLLVGTLGDGVLPLAAHTIPNQVLMIVCQFPFAFGTALAIRMGHILSSSVDHARRMVAGTCLMSFLFFTVVCFGIHLSSDFICKMFTSDEEVITLAKAVWWKVTAFNINVALFALLCGTATGLGMQWTLAAINILFLWIIGMPITYRLALVEGGGLQAVWSCINFPYMCMNVSLILIFTFSDWQKVQKRIQERHEAETTPELEAQQKITNKGFKTEEEGLLEPISSSAKQGYGSTKV